MSNLCLREEKKKTKRAYIHSHTHSKSATVHRPHVRAPSSRKRWTGIGKKKRRVHEAITCIFHDSFMSKLPWLLVPCSPVGDHSSCRHTPRMREHASCTSTSTPASWNRRRVHCIISWFFYAPKNTSSALNCITAASSYLPWIDLVWITLDCGTDIIGFMFTK